MNKGDNIRYSWVTLGQKYLQVEDIVAIVVDVVLIY